jgi:hypothetical protein
MRLRRFRTTIAALGIVVALATAAFATSSFAGSESTTLRAVAGPVPFVESDGDGFATAKFLNNGPSTVNQGLLQIKFEPGVADATFDSTCTQVVDPSTTLVIRVDCELGQVPPSPAGVSRVVYWTAPHVEVNTPLTITASIFYKNDPNSDTVPAPPVTHTTIILPGRDGVDDADSACTSSRSVHVNTNLANAVDTQSSDLAFTADDLGLACYWGVVGEAPFNAQASCGGSPCKTGFWFASLPEARGDLTLTLYELPQGVSLSKFVLREFRGYPADVATSNVVPLCDAAGVLPNAANPTCERPRSREKFGMKGAIFHLRVFGTGRDPGYAG